MSNPYFKILKNLASSNEVVKEQISLGVPNGVYCTDLDEEYATRAPAACEIIREGKHGQFIVLGRDRTGTLAEGSGAAGLERSGMIDMYVGPGSCAESDNKKFNKDTLLNPSFVADASRIYITQTSLGIDKAFGLEASVSGASSFKKSAIGIKSDHVRIISREKMVLYCGRAHHTNGTDKYGERNSNNQKILDPPRIELLTDKPDDLQPAVLGNNLVKYLEKRQEAHRKLLNEIVELNTQLVQINIVLTALSFGAPPFSKNALDGVINVIDNVQGSFNAYIEDINGLDKGYVKGGGSILSDSVFVS